MEGEICPLPFLLFVIVEQLVVSVHPGHAFAGTRLASVPVLDSHQYPNRELAHCR